MLYAALSCRLDGATSAAPAAAISPKTTEAVFDLYSCIALPACSAEKLTPAGASLRHGTQWLRCVPLARGSGFLRRSTRARGARARRDAWDAAQKASVVQMQFDAQHAYYQEHYGGATFDVVLAGGEPAGRLYVSREADEIRIVDIALLPEYCSRGIGTALLRGLQSEAGAAGKPLRIHVERFNPALNLYHRLGFRQVEDRGVYLFMEWRWGV